MCCWGELIELLQELKVLVRSVRTRHACNFQDMWKRKAARPTNTRQAGYAPVRCMVGDKFIPPPYDKRL